MIRRARLSARASHITIRLTPLDTVPLPKSEVNLGFVETAGKQHSGNLDPLCDFFAGGFDVGYALALTDGGFLRRHAQRYYRVVPGRIPIHDAQTRYPGNVRFFDSTISRHQSEDLIVSARYNGTVSHGLAYVSQ